MIDPNTLKTAVDVASEVLRDQPRDDSAMGLAAEGIDILRDGIALTDVSQHVSNAQAAILDDVASIAETALPAIGNSIDSGIRSVGSSVDSAIRSFISIFD